MLTAFCFDKWCPGGSGRRDTRGKADVLRQIVPRLVLYVLVKCCFNSLYGKVRGKVTCADGVHLERLRHWVCVNAQPRLRQFDIYSFPDVVLFTFIVAAAFSSAIHVHFCFSSCSFFFFQNGTERMCLKLIRHVASSCRFTTMVRAKRKYVDVFIAAAVSFE